MRKPPAVPMPRTGGGMATMTVPSWMLAAFARARPGWQRADWLGIAGALLERIEHDEDGAGVGRGRARGAGEADDVHGVGDAGNLQCDLGRAPIDRVGARERGAAGKLRHDDEIADVELRDEADRRLAELVHAEGEHGAVDDEHDRRQSARRAP